MVGHSDKITAFDGLEKQKNLLVGIKKVVQKLGIPITTIRRWENKGIMPKSVRFCKNGPRYWEVKSLKIWVSTLDIPAPVVEQIHQVLDSK